ncbi:MAG: DUF177 domain-containing protein [Lachnospiraceae bacterium]|nr:DUF177 domain-containing protein [Lachnospiraceae bacterium]
MHIHLSDSLTGGQESRAYEAELGFDLFDDGVNRYPVVQKDPVRLRVTKIGEKRLLFEAEVSFSMLIPCDRCLEPVVVPFSYEVNRKADFGEGASEEETAYLVEGYTLDVDALVRDELFMYMPAKVLCREDCKGICNRCGANLNQGDCGCDRTEPDPRMAKVRDIFRDANQ